MAWTQERVEILKRMWGAGKSGEDIASRLGGVTRNAVIGKAHRLGLERGEDALRASRVRGGKIQGKARASAAKTQFGKGKRTRTPAAPPPPKPRIPVVHVSTFTGAIIPGPSPIPPRPLPAPNELTGQPITTLEITSRTCCWPLNDGAPEWLFCGVERDPKSGIGRERGYCTAHRRKSLGRAA